ncbi:hypothetical protein S40285_06452 [Stachybotrys chlorohalonatus IBT 40285]|uniref:Peptidase A1 domain-containing protein n=1 Tax=Stachybotrys chlorohalonatus (strain IBT 40285) TaxID=1283841 RepID=A0A084QB90_STAC4|nr:hypothetical protein S40285_06452 [Stachybotrys chlorohalonata IBT 40285]
MRSTVLLANLALWSSTTYAFYPYMPDWMKEERQSRRELGTRNAKGVEMAIKQRSSKTTLPPSERAARAADRLTAKYSRRQLPDSNGPITKRDNQFEVMEAPDTDQTGSAGLHQDGSDMSYFVQIQLGSEGREYYMLVDTGAGSSWIMSDQCRTEACTLHDTYGPSQSESIEESDREFQIVYGTGEVNGTLATDSLTIAGISLDYQFGLAHNTSRDFINFVFDGILGFSMDRGVNQNLVEALAESGELEDNLFSIALHRAADGDNVGQLSLGSINADRYTGDISYSPLLEGDEWTVEIEDMSYDGRDAGVGGIRSYIDSGTSYIFGPPQLVERLHRLIPGANTTDQRTWTVPCDSEDALEFTFSGQSYSVSARDWISPNNNNGRCTSNIYGVEVVRGAWLLGDTFLKNVYAVFDIGERQIGFAPLATPSESDSGSESETSTRPAQPSSTSAPGSDSDPTGTTSVPSTASAPAVTSVPATTSAPEAEPTTTLDRTVSTGQETETTAGTSATDSAEDPDADRGESAAPGTYAQAAGISTILSVAVALSILL